jgi:hypothetical protein
LTAGGRYLQAVFMRAASAPLTAEDS